MFKLTAQDLGKRFGARKVFSGINFELATGEALAIVGPNGSGKTTMLMTILGELHPTKGKIEVAGDDGSLTSDEFRERSSLVGPYLNLYDGLTGEENMVFFASVAGVHLTGKERNALLARVGLEGRGADLTGAYSSGMKQRLKYAVALLGQPDFLFLDEPTSNLDDAGKQMVYDLIEEQKRRAIVIIATNEREDQRFASQFCRVD